MSPKKRKDGTKLIDIRLPRFGGRVAKRSGLTNDHEVQLLRDSIRSLYRREQDSVIRLWLDDEISPNEVIDIFKSGTVPKDYLIRKNPLYESLTDWSQSENYGEENKRIFRYLLPRVNPLIKHRFIGDLPTVLYQMKASKKITKVDFNTFRKLCLSYVRNNSPDKTRSNLYQEIRAIEQFNPREHKRKNNHNPFSINNLDLLLEEYSIPKFGKDWIWWWCLHGLRPIELYEQGWEIKKSDNLEYLMVYGKKTPSSERRIPLIQQPPSDEPIPRTTVRTYLQKMKRQLYDCRRTYAVVLDNAKVPRNVISRWLGHSGVSNVTELYLLQDDLKWIREYAPQVQEWIETELDHTYVTRDSKFYSPYKDRDDIGKNRQEMTLDDIKERLNGILAEWYWGDNDWMRNLYEVEGLVLRKKGKY